MNILLECEAVYLGQYVLEFLRKFGTYVRDYTASYPALRT